MSVIVKDMKMPNSCINCDLFSRDEIMYCTLFPRCKPNFMTILSERAEWCPLVEVLEQGED